MKLEILDNKFTMENLLFKKEIKGHLIEAFVSLVSENGRHQTKLRLVHNNKDVAYGNFEDREKLMKTFFDSF